MGHAQLLSKPIDREKLYLYLVVSKESVNAALVREEKKVQWPMYYVSKRLLDTETRYLELEKLVLALVIASRKLRSYFHTHSIEILTNYPLHQVLPKPKTSERLLNWAIELGQFNLNYKPNMAIKGQVLTNFIVKFTYSNTTKVAGTTGSAKATKGVEMGMGMETTPSARNNGPSMWMVPLMRMDQE